MGRINIEIYSYKKNATVSVNIEFFAKYCGNPEEGKPKKGIGLKDRDNMEMIGKTSKISLARTMFIS